MIGDPHLLHHEGLIDECKACPTAHWYIFQVSHIEDYHIGGVAIMPILTSTSTNTTSPPVSQEHVPPIDPVSTGVTPSMRRTTRGVRPPILHQNYVTKASTNSRLYSIASVVDYTDLSPHYQSFVSKFSTDIEPTSYTEAAKDVRWI
ncbi:hypothetical protein KY285_001386 [Solanum tuberosum]|nr:hypothetical protein KY285_001386 [Solanum tuberosum]